MIKTKKLEFGPNSTESLTNLKTQIIMKFTYSYCDKNKKNSSSDTKNKFLTKV